MRNNRQPCTSSSAAAFARQHPQPGSTGPAPGRARLCQPATLSTPLRCGHQRHRPPDQAHRTQGPSTLAARLRHENECVCEHEGTCIMPAHVRLPQGGATRHRQILPQPVCMSVIPTLQQSLSHRCALLQPALPPQTRPGRSPNQQPASRQWIKQHACTCCSAGPPLSIHKTRSGLECTGQPAAGPCFECDPLYTILCNAQRAACSVGVLQLLQLRQPMQGAAAFHLLAPCSEVSSSSSKSPAAAYCLEHRQLLAAAIAR